MPSAADIVALKLELDAEASVREAQYDSLEDAYGGPLADRQRKGAFPITQPNTRPDHISAEKDTDNDVVVNRSRAMVEATRSYIGRLPTMFAPPHEASEEARALAEKRERVGYGLWDVWNMARKMSDIGYYCSLLGTAIGCMWPDMERKLPSFIVRSPRGFRCVPKDDDGYRLEKAMFVAKYDGRVAANITGAKKLANESEVEVIQYIDEQEMCFVVGEEKLRGVTRHKLGFCPVVCIPNIGIPGSPFGESTITQMVIIQKYINYLTSILVGVAEDQLCQPLILPDAAKYPEGLPNGPRDVIELPADFSGQMPQRVPPPQIPFDVFRIIELLQTEAANVSDVPQTMLGGSQMPYASGRSVTAQLGPVQAMLNVRTETIYPALKRLMWMAFKMMETMWPKETQTLYGMQRIYGRNDKAPFTETFNIEEFGGWYEFVISSNVETYFDEESRHMRALQDVQNGTLSKETYMQQSPFIPPGGLDREKERVRAEVAENYQLNAAATAAAESVSTQNAPLNDVGKTAYGIEKGYVGELGPAPMPGGVTPGATEGAQPDAALAQLVDLLRSVPKLKGRVFVMGEMLSANEAAEGTELYPEGSAPQLTIGLTDMADKATITNYVKNTVPEVWGNITFVRVDGEPDEPYIDVSPGTSGYEATGEVEAPEAELMQEMMV